MLAGNRSDAREGQVLNMLDMLVTAAVLNDDRSSDESA
jgi:hypothetical protein